MSLLINHELGIACQVNPNPIQYSEHYWHKYQKLRTSPEAEAINQARLNLVSKYPNHGVLIDIGIGNGHFCETTNCKGYDINPFGIKWLKNNDKYIDPFIQKNDSLCFWDVLEHIIDPSIILSTITRYCFISMPIVKSWDNIESWKHYRPDEHLWAFTEYGLINFMKKQGFRHCETNDAETLAGRQDILSFVFEKIK